MPNHSIDRLIADYVIQYKENHYRLAYSYVRNTEDALDVVQESIYKALSAKNSLKDTAYLKTWFYRIIVNTALDFLRRRKRLKVAEEGTLISLDGGALDHYQDIDLRRALDALPADYRSIIILHYFEDLRLEDVAEILDKNVNTVKTQLYRTLKRLRLEMDDKESQL
ncbi:sigma-70 family RNA polymerase sigma factor [Desulfofalx alkaliphila]|uniref:sigma-70 family RNA polymerase sigma factor n=1 Tax=Desulfofalx alkaliphila TaxID=105483 RepID=UPI0004E19D93|nr:sigma-70 family RNA polymerase sigma factor [Desulfofalx alkaliphila]